MILNNTDVFPGRTGQTELSCDQTIFERTHILGALKLHGLEKASSALLSGQWSGTCLIRSHFGLGRYDQRQFQAHTSLIRGQFERILQSFFRQMSSLLSVNNTAAFWSDPFESLWGWWEPRIPVDGNCRSPYEKSWNHCRSKRFFHNCLSSSIQLKTRINGMLKLFFGTFFSLALLPELAFRWLKIWLKKNQFSWNEYIIAILRDLFMFKIIL